MQHTMLFHQQVNVVQLQNDAALCSLMQPFACHTLYRLVAKAATTGGLPIEESFGSANPMEAATELVRSGSFHWVFIPPGVLLKEPNLWMQPVKQVTKVHYQGLTHTMGMCQHSLTSRLPTCFACHHSACC
jgi:hypothetical protein